MYCRRNSSSCRLCCELRWNMMDICSDLGWKKRRRRRRDRSAKRRSVNRTQLTLRTQRGPGGCRRNLRAPLPPGHTLDRRVKRAGPPDLRGTRQVGEEGGLRRATMEERDGERPPLNTLPLPLYPHHTLQPQCQVLPTYHTHRFQQKDAQHHRPYHHTHQHQRKDSQ